MVGGGRKKKAALTLSIHQGNTTGRNTGRFKYGKNTLRPELSGGPFRIWGRDKGKYGRGTSTTLRNILGLGGGGKRGATSGAETKLEEKATREGGCTLEPSKS